MSAQDEAAKLATAAEGMRVFAEQLRVLVVPPVSSHFANLIAAGIPEGVAAYLAHGVQVEILALLLGKGAKQEDASLLSKLLLNVPLNS